MMKTIREWMRRIKFYPILKSDLDNVRKELIKVDDNLEVCNKKYNKLNLKIEDDFAEKSEEIYWNNKRPKTNVYWNARDDVKMDVRVFYQTDSTLTTFKGSTDERAKKCLRWVIENISYVGDSGEFWQYSYETLLSNTGDCEDGAILLANMMEMSGIPYWRIRLNKGYVEGGYHAYLTYLRESDNQWVICDWCYWPDESLHLDNLWKDAEKYFTIDSSWNSKYSFGGLK